MATIDDLKKVRLEKLEALRKLGVDPYPPKVRREQSIGQAREMDGRSVAVVGRIMAMRGHGKIVFWDIMDESGKVQIVCKSDQIPRDSFTLLQYFDIGDFIAVQGLVGKTQAGEVSIFVENFQMITKTIRPLPDVWHGLKDIEERYRKRYLDMILNTDVKKRLSSRSVVVDAFRDFLTTRNFLEVETPTLQPVYGGGFARPFVTHHNALDADFYLRISDEMYLKRLIVGGFEKVFEITKVFRNEGVDHDHNPEFTMFEAQIAYEDYHYGMDIVEELLEYTAKRVTGKTNVEYQDAILEFARPWKRYRLVDAVKEFTGVDPLKWKSVEDAKAAVISLKLSDEMKHDLDKMQSIGEVTAFAFEVFVEEKLIQPTIIYDYPVEVSPLAKKCDDLRFTQRFEMFAFGSEIGNNYTELNDPVDLRQRFVEEKKREAAGFDEAHQTDYDYLNAIEHGFPPTCGLGIGMDRVTMLLTDGRTIKEVIPFPTLKPETQTAKRISSSGSDQQTVIDPIFAQTYPSASVGYALIQQVTIKKKDNALEQEKVKVLDEYKGITVKQIDAYPELQSYRTMYKKMGVDFHSRRPSPEALLRRVAQGKGLYSVNTCVDAYNLIVMKHRVSLGAFDADHMKLPSVVTVAQGGETIELLGVEGATTIEKGEIIYADQIGPYNLDYNYRDAERTKVTEKTKNIIINVDGVYDIDEQKVRKSLEDAIKIITKYCGGQVVEAGIVKANGERTVLVGKTADVPYRERKIVAIVNSELNKGQATNAIGHMAVSAGRYLDDSWIGESMLKDADGIAHKGISKHPFIILSASTKQVRELVTRAKHMGLFCVDYPQEMFDTGTDEDLVKAMSKVKEKDMIYHAVVLAGKTHDIDVLTKGLQLYK
ncbi:MAG TPA: lysine--tRNA ligase [Patescibacteria group bacterium]|nr:lysine--tRNA ligase [Patescibacteria group bacterium]